MLEHLTRPLYYFEVHLLYASISAGAAWLLTSMRVGSATVKYWIWLAVSLNFILPAGALLDKALAPHLAWATPLGAIGQAAASFTHSPAASSALMVWLIGALFMLIRLSVRLVRERRASALGPARGPWTPDLVAHGIPIYLRPNLQAPAVHGLLHPRIVLPMEAASLLDVEELRAVLLHELTHARRRDNLLRLFHEVSLCLLWFHPLVWFAATRLALYRELSCDEAAVRGACGRQLVSALGKFAAPHSPVLMRASLSSFMSLRLSRLTCQSGAASTVANAGMVIAFAAAVAVCVFATVAHTACCFIAKV